MDRRWRPRFRRQPVEGESDGTVRYLDLDQLVPGRYQPRQRVDEAYLAELEQSIRQLGVIEPLVARPLADGSHEILAGHALASGATEPA